MTNFSKLLTGGNNGSLITRRHFEAAVHSIAKHYGLDPQCLRNEIKKELIIAGRMKMSTKEIEEGVLSRIADNLTGFMKDQENCPPEWSVKKQEFYTRLPQLLYVEENHERID